MENKSIKTCMTTWHWIVYVSVWLFMWIYFMFIAPTSFKLLSDINQNLWFISKVPQYTLFFGMIISFALLIYHHKNNNKLQSETGGNPLNSILSVSAAYLITIITFIGEVAIMIQTAIAIPFK